MFKINFQDQVYEHTTAMEMSLTQTIVLLQWLHMTEREGYSTTVYVKQLFFMAAMESNMAYNWD